MPRKMHIEAILESFENNKIVLNQEQADYKKRLILVMDIKLNNVYIQDIALYKKIKKDYPFITFPQICNDISIVERMIANIKNPNGNAEKVWIRYFITEVSKKAIEIAQSKDDAYTMAYAAGVMGKHHLTDKEDVERPNFDDIVPWIPQITSDVSVLGIKPIKDLSATRAKLEAKYGYNRIEEVEIVSELEENEES